MEEWNHDVISDDIRAGGGFGPVLEPADGGPLTGLLAYVGRVG